MKCALHFNLAHSSVYARAADTNTQAFNGKPTRRDRDDIITRALVARYSTILLLEQLAIEVVEADFNAGPG